MTKDEEKRIEYLKERLFHNDMRYKASEDVQWLPIVEHLLQRIEGLYKDSCRVDKEFRDYRIGMAFEGDK